MRYPFASTENLPDVMELPFVTNDWVRADGDVVMINLLVKAAMRYAENYCDRPLFGRTFTTALSDFSCGYFGGYLPESLSISYDTGIQAGNSLDASAYCLYPNGQVNFVQNAVRGLSATGVKLTYQAGYPSNNIPEDILLALLLIVDNMYENRSNPVSEKRTAADNFLSHYKYYSV